MSDARRSSDAMTRIFFLSLRVSRALPVAYLANDGRRASDPSRSTRPSKRVGSFVREMDGYALSTSLMDGYFQVTVDRSTATGRDRDVVKRVEKRASGERMD